LTKTEEQLHDLKDYADRLNRKVNGLETKVNKLENAKSGFYMRTCFVIASFFGLGSAYLTNLAIEMDGGWFALHSLAMTSFGGFVGGFVALIWLIIYSTAHSGGE
jgi:hypothetical protein